MRMILFSTLVLVLLILSAPLQTNAQQPKKGTSGQKSQKPGPTARFDSGKSALKIPIEIDNNLILMRVSVDDSMPLKFIFDTGASHTVIDSGRAAELGLKAQGQFTGNATGGRIQGDLFKGVSLSVPGAEVSNQLITSLPLPKIPGFEFDGILGYDFINEFVVEIDYQNKIMNLYNPRTYAYSGKGEVIPLSLAGRRTPLVNIKIIPEGRAAPVKAKLEVDTGADGTLVINGSFVEKQKLLAAIPKTTQGGGVGVGDSEQKRLTGRVKAVQLGRFIFDNPPVAFSQDTEEARVGDEGHGIIGGEIFRRFKVILDYSRKRMILKPNKSFNDPYDVEN